MMAAEVYASRRVIVIDDVITSARMEVYGGIVALLGFHESGFNSGQIKIRNFYYASHPLSHLLPVPGYIQGHM